jgi:hypothetical protein
MPADPAKFFGLTKYNKNMKTRQVFFLSVILLLSGSNGFSDVKENAVRSQRLEQYLTEFSSGDFAMGEGKIRKAITRVLEKMPYRDFLKVTDSRRPIIFTEVWDTGTARFASSTEMIFEKNQTPCCQNGFTIVKLSMALNDGPIEAIEGVVAHEVAHRVLENIRHGHVDCRAERASNRLIKRWGLKSEFEEAKNVFGTKKGDSVSCQGK